MCVSLVPCYPRNYTLADSKKTSALVLEYDFDLCNTASNYYTRPGPSSIAMCERLTRAYQQLHRDTLVLECSHPSVDHVKRLF